MGSGNCEELGKLLNRLTVSFLIYFHGYHYLTLGSHVNDRIVGYGLPAALGIAIGSAGQWVGEIIAPTMIVLGVYARLGGALIFVYMIAAVAMVHMGHLFMLVENKDGYFLESQTFFLMGGATVALLGAGKYSLNIGGKWN